MWQILSSSSGRSEIDLDLLQKSIDIRKTLVITRSNQDNG